MDANSQIQLLIQNLDLTEAQINQLAQNLTDLRNAALIETDDAVAKAKDGSHLTRAGFDLLAKAVAGKELKYTRVAFGDGVLDGQILEPTLDEQYEFNNIINWKMDLPMSDVSFTGNGTAAIKFAVKNAEIQQGFFIRELGLFALDPDTGEEKLYCYRNSGLLSDYIPAGNGAVVWDIIMTIITVIDSATNVTAVIDAGLAYVSQAEFNAHINSENPHPNIPTKMSEVTATGKVWGIDEDANLHPITVENLAKQILGGDAADLPKMNSRLTQTEINISNLYMQLKAEKELGLTANLLLVEDFSKNECCDLYECEVISSFAGFSNITLADDRGLLSGMWYTITDGVNSEYVKVNSVARNGEQIGVMLDQPLVYTYNPECTKLVRSTALISGGKAYGAGDIRGLTYKFDEVFAGTGGNVQTILTLDTSQKNIDAFTLEGDAAFNSKGEFTLTA